MKQLKTIREAWETLLTNLDHAVTAGAWRVAEGSQTWDAVQEAKQALVALSELDRMAGEQEPCGWLESLHGAFRANPMLKMRFPPSTRNWQIPVYTAAPPAQQPQEPEMTPAFRSSHAYAVGFQDGKAQALAQQPQAETVPPGVTDAMVDAYLQANDAYWRETDAQPKSPVKWRNGNPKEATRVSLAAAIAAAQGEKP